jgi:hypothetical protein
MNLTLNQIKEKVYRMALELNDNFHDSENGSSKFIFIFGIRITHYTNTGIFSIKEMNDEVYKEISNRYILRLMIKNLEELCKTKKENPEMKIHSRKKK